MENSVNKQEGSVIKQVFDSKKVKTETIEIKKVKNITLVLNLYILSPVTGTLY